MRSFRHNGIECLSVGLSADRRLSVLPMSDPSLCSVTATIKQSDPGSFTHPSIHHDEIMQITATTTTATKIRSGFLISKQAALRRCLSFDMFMKHDIKSEMYSFF